MIDAINGLIEAVMASPWAYLAIFLVSAVDAFFPVVPSETTVIAAGVLAAAGKQSLLWVIAVGGLGAVAGDHISYLIGRLFGRPAIDWLLRGDRGRQAREWATRALRTRGGLMIVVCRFIPGGRTATTLAAGALSYPLSRFTPFDALAAACWATYSALIGYFTGAALQGNHLLAVGVGIGVAVALSLVAEVTRWALRHRANRGGGDDGHDDTGSDSEDAAGQRHTPVGGGALLRADDSDQAEGQRQRRRRAGDEHPDDGNEPEHNRHDAEHERGGTQPVARRRLGWSLRRHGASRKAQP